MAVLHRTIAFALFASASFSLVGCADETAPFEATISAPKMEGTRDASAPMPDVFRGTACAPLQSAEPIPARTIVMSEDAVAGDDRKSVQELYDNFKSLCGACHVERENGGFRVKFYTELKDKLPATALERLMSDDDIKVMPPVPLGKPVSQRQVGDPVTELAKWVSAWSDQGRGDTFTLPREIDPSMQKPYLMTPQEGRALTNIGSCVPAQPIVSEKLDRMSDLDAKFVALQKLPPGMGTPAERIGLPEKLDETDLFTLDTEELARNRVIAYAPTYPLWSDGARKIRHIRVPAGESVKFDKDKQTFDIPDNTRFYKTFLKPVREKDGTVRYRKVETRLIVARHDRQRPDGTFEATSLFGTYEWDAEETEARLHVLPYRNGEPFSDHKFPLITDEIIEQDVIDSEPRDLDTALRKAGAVRHYAVPGSDRCVQCHMGSPTHDFILGFFPLQVLRRPAGEGGVIEPAGPDELTQLQRLIDYGIISGMASPSDVVPLELSQGARKPRNDYELTAQGYMLGNCAHCHNPRGYPTVSNPELAQAKVLDFLPSTAQTGGIFQFPLEAYSPRISRGFGNTLRIPYITPSLYDYPAQVADNWIPKSVPKEPLLPGFGNCQYDYQNIPQFSVLAPWRSLIYRNVDTPYIYAEHYALFPHMPMNVPGYDCRAARLLGDWMTSIPAVRKSEFATTPDGTEIREDLLSGATPDPVGKCDASEQPYTEVKPGEAGYDNALATAKQRLVAYHHGQMTEGGPSRYRYCPDTSDIEDPSVTGKTLDDRTPKDLEQHGGPDGTDLVMIRDSVPDRPHWVVTDITEVPGKWEPRGYEWNDYLVNNDFTKNVPLKSDPVAYDQWQKQQDVVLVLSPKGKPGVTLDDIRTFATTERPFGLWDENLGCDFSKVPTVGSFAPENRPKWFAHPEAKASADRHVYMQLPGEAVFNNVCINCHGVNFDSRGRQADSLLAMTGGSARVANFRNGLFGAGGQNRADVFGVAESPSATVEDWAARYMVWMALGGTKAGIPKAILNLVAGTSIVGQKRNPSLAADSANMLDVAVTLCLATLPRSREGGNAEPFDYRTGLLGSEARYLIFSNGDAELWSELCAVGNPAPVRALKVNDGGTGLLASSANNDGRLYPAKDYPADALVADPAGHITMGVQPGNRFPWCVVNDAKGQAFARAPENAIGGQPLPLCPANMGVPLDENQQRAWGTRGAMNAGMSVFLFLDKVLVRKDYQPKPRYNRCDQLTPP